MQQLFFYSNIRYLIDSSYPSIYAFIKANQQMKQNTVQDYYNRTNESHIYPKFENVLEFAKIFNVSLDDLVYKNLSKGENNIWRNSLHF